LVTCDVEGAVALRVVFESLSMPKFNTGTPLSSSSSSRLAAMGDQSPMLPVRPRRDGRVAAKEVTPLPTVMPPVLAPKESRGILAPLSGLFRRLLSPAFADEFLLPVLSFHEKPLIVDEKDEWRPRRVLSAPDMEEDLEPDGVAAGDRR
jgi:hypothetical protein